MTTPINPQEYIHRRLTNEVKEREVLNSLIFGTEDTQADINAVLKEHHISNRYLTMIYRFCHEMLHKSIKLNRHSLESTINQRCSREDLGFVMQVFMDIIATDMEDTVENTISILDYHYKNRKLYYEVIHQTNSEFMNNVSPEEMVRRISDSLLSMDENNRSQTIFQIAEKVGGRIFNPNPNNVGKLTGLEPWDRNFGGLLEDNLIVIGGISGSGKTALVIDLIHRLSEMEKTNDYTKGIAICFFSLEMAEDRIARRLISRSAKVTEHRMMNHGRNGIDPLTANQKSRIEKALVDLSEYPLEIVYEPMSARDVKIKARRFALKNPGKHLVFILDHLDELQKTSTDRNLESERGIQAMKDLCVEHRATSIALVQLRKELESPKYAANFHKPSRDFLMNSTMINAKADIVILTWRPEMYTKSLPSFLNYDQWNTRGKGIWVIAKNRDGQGQIDEVLDCDVRYNIYDQYTPPLPFVDENPF